MNLRATPVSSLANLGPHKPRLCHATDCSHTREVSSFSCKLLGSPSQQGTPSFDFSILLVFSIFLRLLPWAAQAAQAFQNSLDLSQTPLQARLRYHASGKEALDSQHCKCWESYVWRGTSTSNRGKDPNTFCSADTVAEDAMFSIWAWNWKLHIYIYTWIVGQIPLG